MEAGQSSTHEDGGDGLWLAELTAEIVAAYVSNNGVHPGELPGVIAEVYTAIAQVRTGQTEPERPAQEPAVPVKKSVRPDYIISLETGQQFKSLTRHLRSLGMSPEEYRAKWGLPRNYPMVASSYSKARSELARTSGLGRRAGSGPAGRMNEPQASNEDGDAES